jgi:hypothetical protein
MFGSPQAISGEIVRLLCITICRLQKRGINWGGQMSRWDWGFWWSWAVVTGVGLGLATGVTEF